VLDTATSTVLDAHTIGDFGNGVYLVWNVKGNVTFRVASEIPGSNAVLSGVFFGGVAIPTPTPNPIVPMASLTWRVPGASGKKTKDAQAALADLLGVETGRVLMNGPDGGPWVVTVTVAP
jgi:hypothetical protein